MHQYDINRVEFYSKEDLAGTHMLEKADKILRKDINKLVTDINDILEYYHIKKYLDNEIFLKKWTNNDIQNFQEKCKNYDQLIKQFFAKINNENILEYYNQIIGNYIDSFWKIINSLNYYKNISKTNFHNILQKEPFLIDTILEYKGLVEYYKSIIRAFLLNNKQSAEILLSIYEKKKDFNEKTKYLPSNLSVKDKEQIIFNYLEGGEVNLNYLKLIENARDGSDFKVSDKARLRARKLHRYEIENLLKGEDRGAVEYGVSITFPENMNEIKNGEIDENNTLNYQYSADFILKNNQPYSLFRFFDILFEYVDEQQRIKLLSKKNQIDAIERFVGIQSKNEYFVSTIFHLSHITSQMQIFAYDNLLCGINMSIEEILKEVFTKVFQEKYNFPHNANFITPISTNSFLEKIRIIAPEFESILKQYKLFVEDGTIDFELLQISSKPTKIKDIPSLNNDKYIYLNEENTEIINCVNIFFSDQNILTNSSRLSLLFKFSES